MSNTKAQQAITAYEKALDEFSDKLIAIKELYDFETVGIDELIEHLQEVQCDMETEVCEEEDY